MVELRDGALLCLFEGDGSVFACRSVDTGRTWGAAVPVAWHQTGINMSAPEVIELQDGSILACYNPRPFRISGLRNFGIRTRKSYDGGRTWIHGRLLYEAGHNFTDGCWEPAPVQLPDGEILVFFADEAPFAGAKGDDQHIALLRSTDGGLSWSEEPEIVSYKRNGRDGMPVPLLLNGDKGLVCAIEQTTTGGKLQPAVLRMDANGRIGQVIGSHSRRREEPLAGLIGVEIYAGAPYLRQLSTGETLLSYQGTEGRPNRLHCADMKVWVGDENGRNFAGPSIPFVIPKNRSALWNSLCVLRDDTIIALTSTNAFAGKSEVWMIKGRLRPSVVEEWWRSAKGEVGRK
jgi:hypothetical protein